MIGMYETRQHKERFSRVFFDANKRDKSKRNTIASTSIFQCLTKAYKNSTAIQRVKTIVIEMLPSRPTHLTTDAQNINRRKHYISQGLGNVHYNYGRGGGGVIPNVLIGAQAPRMVSNSFSNAGNIGIDETIIIVSHGMRYIPIFAYKTPRGLASEVFNSQILPIGYSGQIYLDGCHTGEPGLFGDLGDGSSFVEKFKQELLNLSNHGVPLYGDFKVKGNLGAAMTASYGTEWIEGDNRTFRLIGENMNNMANHIPPIPFWTSNNHSHSRLRVNKQLFGLIKKPVIDYRGRFTKVVY